MSPAELDQVYSTLCRTMTRLGESNAPLFLARLSLLAIERLGDGGTALGLIESAAEDIDGAGPR